MWSRGICRAESGAMYEYEVKHYSEGSEFGIDGGRISKMWIATSGKEVASYERGWDVEPEVGSEAYKVMRELIQKYN